MNNILFPLKGVHGILMIRAAFIPSIVSADSCFLSLQHQISLISLRALYLTMGPWVEVILPQVRHCYQIDNLYPP